MLTTEVFERAFASLSTAWKINTRARYRTILEKYVNPYFSKLQINEISQKDVDGYAAGLAALPLAPATRALVLVFTQKLLRSLSEEFPDLKALKFRFPKIPKRQVRVMPGADAEALARGLRKKGTRRCVGLLLALCTGLRLSELCGLRYGDFDFARGCFRVSRIYHRVQAEGPAGKTRPVFEAPKTLNSVREVPIPPNLLAALREQAAGADRYILSGTAAPVEPRLLDYHFRRILHKLNIAPTHFHILRHTYATRAIETGTDVKTLSEILGHANVGITLSLYVHPTLEHKRECIAKSSVFAA